MNVKTFAMALGAIYLVVGLLGFVPALRPLPVEAPPLSVGSGYGYLLGMFPVNILHTLVHLAIGVWGLVAMKDFGAARNYARGVAIIFAVLTIMGLFPGLNTTFGLIPLHGHDVWLHALTAIAAAYFGFMAPATDGAYGRTTTANR